MGTRFFYMHNSDSSVVAGFGHKFSLYFFFF